MFMTALCTTAKTWKQLKWIRTDEWINKMGYTHARTHTHTHTQCCISHHTKGDIMPCPATRKEVETIIVSEVRQRQVSYDIT